MQSIYDHKYVEFLRIDRLGEEFKWLIDVNELVSTFQNWVYKYLGQQILDESDSLFHQNLVNRG